jgi:FtsZ-binding cell division protein ZapB
MDLYDISRQLNQKVDKHELYSLQLEIDKLKRENQQLRNKAELLSSKLNQLQEILFAVVTVVKETADSTNDNTKYDVLIGIEHKF